ncbi:hypothetical protein F4825DRAFT_135633 [Nemania diffusa]|nr:hypothetical protein F4825DRAFT_135633 [Nemania diffusa]
MDFSFQGIVQKHASQMEAAFQGLVNTIVQNSKLIITMLRISLVTEDSFHVSLEARITKTGPASATIASMTLDLCGPSGLFGKVTLPAITTQAYGTDVIVTSQLVAIVDKGALKAFIRAIIQNSTVILSLRNGQTSISALGVGPREMVYAKELELPGMKGPVVSIRAVSIISNDPRMAASPSTASLTPGIAAPLNNSLTSASFASTIGSSSETYISVKFYVLNPSPLEMSFGTCSFNIEDHEGKILAELKGRLDIRCGYFDATFQGSVNRRAVAKLAAAMREAAALGENEGSDEQAPRARLVGRRCAGAGWCDETIKGINVPIKNAVKLFQALGMDDIAEDPRDKRLSLTKWTQKLLMR